MKLHETHDIERDQGSATGECKLCMIEMEGGEDRQYGDEYF